METRIGKIAGLSGHPMSGLWMLRFEDGSHAAIESGHGVRQLAAAFGARSAGELIHKITGQEILYTVDEFGVMSSFQPTQDDNGRD